MSPVVAAPIGPYPHPAPPASLRPWPPQAIAAGSRVIELIRAQIPDTLVEHVGSSSVPGCDGKGYLDFVIPYRDAAHLATINDRLCALGFGRQQNDDPFPESRPMRTGAFVHHGETFLLHVHVVPHESHEAEDLCRFRDALRADSTLAARYVAVKRAILASGITEGDEYARAKESFFADLGFTGASST
ncbi:MAG: GrpB family protein [Thermomicrobiales bacterium]